MSHGVAPVNENTIRQVTELLIPTQPRAVWTDARADPTSRARRPAQLSIHKLGALFRTTPKRTAADANGWTCEHLQVFIVEKEGAEAIGCFLNHTLGGRILQPTLEDMSLVKATPPS